MLVLSRKKGEGIVIGENIKLTVVEVRGNRVKLAFDAPDEVSIHRQEVAQRIGAPMLPPAEVFVELECDWLVASA